MICSYPYRDQDAFTQDVESEAMIKIYGMPTCPYCDYIHEQVKGREDEFEYINIGEHIRNLSAFMRLSLSYLFAVDSIPSTGLLD